MIPPLFPPLYRLEVLWLPLVPRIRKKPRLSLDRSIERMRKHLAESALSRKNDKAGRSLRNSIQNQSD